ncbi:hypothetical protein Plhal304r1_c020g0071431 [Plasmopara halstedii]
MCIMNNTTWLHDGDMVILFYNLNNRHQLLQHFGTMLKRRQNHRFIVVCL